MHDLFVVALPTLAVMFAILLNRQDATAIRGEVKSEIGQQRSVTIALRDSIHRDMVSFHERVTAVQSKNN